MTKERISVAMCTYNGAEFLQEQLDSIACQTLLPNEIIVCDDRSEDNTVGIAEAFRKQAAFKVNLIVNEKRLGFTRNFEKAIKLSRGEVIVLCDQDDVWVPEKLVTLFSVLHEDKKAGYAFSDADLVWPDLKGDGSSLWESINFDYVNYNRGIQLPIMLRKNCVFGMTMAFRSSYREILLPIESSAFYCAHDSWIAIILSGLGAYGIAVPERLVRYRQHSKQSTSGVSKKLGLISELIRRLNLLREDRSGQYAVLSEAYSAIRNRLGTVTDIERQESIISARNLLLEKAMHISVRSRMNDSSRLRRFGMVLGELASGRYHRYSSTLQGPIRDILCVR